MKQQRNNLTHGYAKTPTWHAWTHMRARCRNKNARDYARYGGRGITVDPRWESFENFLADMGERPDGHSLDRIDNNGNYAPGNCRWAKEITQQNNKRSNRHLTFDGREQTVAEWARELGIKPVDKLYRRLYRGWSIEQALTTP
jgi:hypothetical protein